MKLSRCRFCGAPARIMTRIGARLTIQYFASCSGCGIAGERCDTERKAVNRWNKLCADERWDNIKGRKHG